MKLPRCSKEFLIVLVIIAIITIIASGSTLSRKEIRYETIKVEKGDTLWSIALNNQKNNEYYYNQDVRDIMYDIVRVNNLQSKALTVNQSLRIPLS